MERSLKEAVDALFKDKDIIVVTTDANRRGLIAREYAKLFSKKFQASRWGGPAHFKTLSRILTREEFHKKKPKPKAHIDEALRKEAAKFAEETADTEFYKQGGEVGDVALYEDLEYIAYQSYIWG